MLLKIVTGKPHLPMINKSGIDVKAV